MEHNSRTSTRIPTRETSPLAFLAGFLRSPTEVGSVVPSSRFLERKIVGAAGLEDAKQVVELGPGTGGTTRAILSHLGMDATLLTIDTSPVFIDLLNGIPDPRLINHLGSAEAIPDILAQHGLETPDVVISGIPFSTMPKDVGERIAEVIGTVLNDGGRFVAYQFRGDVAEVTEPVMGKPWQRMEWRNLPPMRIYCWTKGSRKADTSA